MKIIDLSTGGSPRASGDDDSTGAAKGAAGRESAPLGEIDRLAPRRTVAVQGIDGQRAAGSARVSNDKAGSRTSFITLIAGSVASVIVSAHAPGKAPRGSAAGDVAEYDRPVRILGERGKGGARERARKRKRAKLLHDVLPSCRRWAGGRSTEPPRVSRGGSRLSLTSTWVSFCPRLAWRGHTKRLHRNPRDSPARRCDDHRAQSTSTISSRRLLAEHRRLRSTGRAGDGALVERDIPSGDRVSRSRKRRADFAA